MPYTKRNSKTTSKPPVQSKLSNFTPKLSLEVSQEANKANTSTCEAMEEENSELTEKRMTAEVGSDVILAAIANLESDFFFSKLDGILSAIENVKNDVNECTERVSEAEIRISTADDSIASLQASIQALEKKQNKCLEEKVLDLEARSRRSNLRLVNLPKGAEGEDACAFLENWLPEVLNLAPLCTALIVERAHRVGVRSTSNTAAPRTLIMKFLNYKDKTTVIKAARAKRPILFKNHQVRLYEALTTGLHKKQKEFDAVKQQRRAMGIRYGMIPPARLLVTHNGQSRTFNQPAEAQNFVKNLRVESGPG